MPSILDRIFRRDQQATTADTDSLRGLIAAVAAAEDGTGDVDEPAALELFEQHGLSADDVQATIAEYRRRVQLAETAADEEAARKRAAKADADFEAADLAEAKRHRAELAKLREMETLALHARKEAERASAARADLLAGAAPPPGEAELGDKLAAINAQIRACEIAIDANATPHVDGTGGQVITQFDGHVWANCETHPAVLLRQAEAALTQENVGHSKERKQQLEATVKRAKAAIADRKKELASLQKQRAELQAKLEKFVEVKLSPESFRIVRATTSADEQRKSYARKLGFDGPTVRYTRS